MKIYTHDQLTPELLKKEKMLLSGKMLFDPDSGKKVLLAYPGKNDDLYIKKRYSPTTRKLTKKLYMISFFSPHSEGPSLCSYHYSVGICECCFKVYLTIYVSKKKLEELKKIYKHYTIEETLLLKYAKPVKKTFLQRLLGK